MFIGRYYHTLESKGRLSIPKHFRSQLKSGGVLTRGLDGCLFLFPDSTWKKLSKTIASLSLTNPTARQFTRLLVQQAAEMEFDRLGRILIPDYLRLIAHLSQKVVVAGALTRIEIWDQDNYHQYLDKLEQDKQFEQQLSQLEI